RVINSFLPFVALTSLYLYLIGGTLSVESLQALANPKLPEITRFFADPRAVTTGWVHFLVFDLFVGRWIYLEGQRTGMWTTHSLVLCLFAGPLGLLSHILTVWLTQGFGSAAPNQGIPDSESPQL
ncbi:MAG TPA: ABA4-like family protein, partial [Candidatus Caenarcaniphilales bacterium]